LRDQALNYETGKMAAAVADKVTEKISSIGEKIQLRRNVKWDVDGTGSIFSYIHMGGKVGVLLELGCEKADTLKSPAFQELAKDLTLHVAAAAPQYLNRGEVPAETVEAEKSIFRAQMKAEDEEKGKSRPAEMVEKILLGKINKFYSQICFLEQGFVKEDKVSITNLVAEKGKALGDTLSIKRYVRYQLGS
jgi:elongation factor Ts